MRFSFTIFDLPQTMDLHASQIQGFFDVPVDKDAERLAEELGVKLFKGKSI